ncbi:hypothetical protein DPMN_136975 [Dreissena polymorpha]|uniref:Uncharacterized protein n=1 Tax=Dreissena polymorpha TaxID=45954 RepID=A0A9D4G4L7_DREPO|nr:hypothetical protein DPMN_136975 [Dreissena polymorpha]
MMGLYSLIWRKSVEEQFPTWTMTLVKGTCLSYNQTKKTFLNTSSPSFPRRSSKPTRRTPTFGDQSERRCCS